MPNRKTFDEREKVDHSSHPLTHRQPSDLKADIQDPEDKVVGSGSEESSAHQMAKRRPKPRNQADS
jgi:hypothetical protein